MRSNERRIMRIVECLSPSIRRHLIDSGTLTNVLYDELGICSLV